MYNMSQSNNNPATNNPNDAPSSYIRMGSMSDEGGSFNISRRGSSLLYPMLRDGSIVEHPNGSNAALASGANNFNYATTDRNSIGLPRNESISQFFSGFNSRSNSDSQTPNFTTSQQQQQQQAQQAQQQQQQQYPLQHQYPPPPPGTAAQPQSMLPHPMNPPAQPHHHGAQQPVNHTNGNNATTQAQYADYNHRYSTGGNAYYDYPQQPQQQAGPQAHHQQGQPGPQAPQAPVSHTLHHNTAQHQQHHQPQAPQHHQQQNQQAPAPQQQHPSQHKDSASNIDPLTNNRRSSEQYDSLNSLRQRGSGNSNYFNRPRQLSILPFQDSSNDFDSFLKRDSIRGLMNYNGGDLLDQYPNFQDQDFQQQYRQHSRNGSTNNGYPNNGGRYSSGNLFDPQATDQAAAQRGAPDVKAEDEPAGKKPKRQQKRKKSQPQSNLENYSFPKREDDHTTHPGSQLQQHQEYTRQDGNRLVPAQEVLHSDDGRPLLGATKVDQLMLVIEARNKGVNKTIPRGEDGSILADQRTGVIPQPIDLVGGVDKHTLSRNKNYQCSYCFKKFTQSTHLEVHVRSHIGYKPYECSFCHKRFTQGGNLRTHLRLHTGERPFHCEFCNRKFSRKGNLQAHKLTHDNLKPYECRLDNCNKAFTQLGNLKSHQNRFHLETLNNLTKKLADLGGSNEEDILFKIENLPYEEQNLLKYFTSTYKNLNRGIRGRGKKMSAGEGQSSGSSASPAMSNHSTNAGH